MHVTNSKYVKRSFPPFPVLTPIFPPEGSLCNQFQVYPFRSVNAYIFLLILLQKMKHTTQFCTAFSFDSAALRFVRIP